MSNFPGQMLQKVTNLGQTCAFVKMVDYILQSIVYRQHIYISVCNQQHIILFLGREITFGNCKLCQREQHIFCCLYFIIMFFFCSKRLFVASPITVFTLSCFLFGTFEIDCVTIYNHPEQSRVCIYILFAIIYTSHKNTSSHTKCPRFVSVLNKTTKKNIAQIALVILYVWFTLFIMLSIQLMRFLRSRSIYMRRIAMFECIYLRSFGNIAWKSRNAIMAMCANDRERPYNPAMAAGCVE